MWYNIDTNFSSGDKNEIKNKIVDRIFGHDICAAHPDSSCVWAYR